jgi:hypothetical protein
MVYSSVGVSGIDIFNKSMDPVWLKKGEVGQLLLIL